MYGSPTPDEAVTRLFQKALPYCNAKKLYIALLDILERTNKVCASVCVLLRPADRFLHSSVLGQFTSNQADGTLSLGCCDQDELAEQTLKAMCRKFSESAKMWLRHITWLLTKDRADAARKVLDKSFAALPQRKHIKVGPDHDN